MYIASSDREYSPCKTNEEEEESAEKKDRRILRDVDRHARIPSVRRDRETFYESFYERLYEPRTELGPRIRFCYTRAATSSPKPRRALYTLVLFLSLSFSLCATQRAVLFSIDSRKYLVFHHHHIRRRYLVSHSIAYFFAFSSFFFFGTLVLLRHISWPCISQLDFFFFPTKISSN